MSTETIEGHIGVRVTHEDIELIITTVDTEQENIEHVGSMSAKVARQIADYLYEAANTLDGVGSQVH